MSFFEAARSVPKTRVLQPYHRESARWWRLLRYVVFLAICTFVSAIFGFFLAVMPYPLYPLFAIPVLILLGLVLWIYPEDRPTSFSLSRKLLFLFILSLGVWPNYLSIAIPGLPWVSARRLFCIPLVLTFGFYLATNRAARKHIVEIMKGHRLFSFFFVLFTLVQFIAMAGAPQLFTSLNRYLINQITWTLPFFVALLAFRERRFLERYCFWLAAIPIGLSLEMLVEYAFKKVPWADHIPSFLQVEAQELSAVVEGSYRFGVYRTIGIWSNPLSCAEFISLCIPFLLMAAARTRSFWKAWFLIGADCVCLFAVYTTGSRLGLIGALFAHLIFIFGWAFSHWRTNSRSLFAPAIVVVYPLCAGLVFAAILFVGRLRGIFISNGSQDYSDQSRIEQFAKAPGVVAKRFLFGYGPAQGGDALDYHQPGGLLTVDSYLLTAILDYGIVGFVSYFAILGLGIVIAGLDFYRKDGEKSLYSLAAMSSLAVYLIIRLVLSQEENQPLMFVMLAMAVSLAEPRLSRAAKRAKAASRGMLAAA